MAIRTSIKYETVNGPLPPNAFTTNFKLAKTLYDAQTKTFIQLRPGAKAPGSATRP